MSDLQELIDRWNETFSIAFRKLLQTQAEVTRLRKIFSDAGQGEHDVLALIEHYQRNSMDADRRIRTVREILTKHGCDCRHMRIIDRPCLACLIGEAVGNE